MTELSSSSVPVALCQFNGQVVGNGQSVIAFLNSATAFGEVCQSETRVCQEGVLNGSYNFSTCEVEGPKACLFDGRTIAHGESLVAFLNSDVAYGESCNQEVRTCNNGVLSGSHAFSSCSPGQPAPCLIFGQSLASGSSIAAFQNSSVEYGNSCNKEVRVCTNGSLSGSFNFASCNIGSAANCSFNGQPIAHGQTVNAFQNSTVLFNQSCVKEARSCNNGELSGSYAFGSCNVGTPASCLFNGQTIAHGQIVNAFQNSSVGFGQVCVQQPRLCENGVLAGSYAFASCNVDTPASCLFNGQTVAHLQTVRAFADSAPAFGVECKEQSRQCNNGSLSGSFMAPSCVPGAPATCQFNGQTIAHGQVVQAFLASTVPFGENCSKQARTCTNGDLSGTYRFASCDEKAPASCLFNGKTIAHGQSVTAYRKPDAYAPGNCEQEKRVCSNGALSGSFAEDSCTRYESRCENPKLQRVSKNTKITFPATLGCQWSVNGNLGRRDGYLQARTETVRAVDIPAGAEVCKANFEFNSGAMRYDDMFIFAYKNVIITSSTDVTRFDSVSGLRLWNWNKIKGLSNQFVNYCITSPNANAKIKDLNQQLADAKTQSDKNVIQDKIDRAIQNEQNFCDFPKTETNGTINLRISSDTFSRINNASDAANSFSFITTGDDNGSDCSSSEISFKMGYEYVP